MLGMIKKTISYKTPEIMVRLYKALVRPHLEYCVSVWSPHYTKDKDLLERLQHRFTRRIKEVRDKEYLDRLKKLNLWTLEERRNRVDLIELFKCIKGLQRFISSRSFVRSLLRAGVQPTLDPSAETSMSVQCASPGRGGELVGVCGVCASCVGWRKG